MVFSDRPTRFGLSHRPEQLTDRNLVAVVVLMKRPSLAVDQPFLDHSIETPRRVDLTIRLDGFEPGEEQSVLKAILDLFEEQVGPGNATARIDGHSPRAMKMFIRTTDEAIAGRILQVNLEPSKGAIRVPTWVEPVAPLSSSKPQASHSRTIAFFPAPGARPSSGGRDAPSFAFTPADRAARPTAPS